MVVVTGNTVSIDLVCDMADCDNRESFSADTVEGAVLQSATAGWSLLPMLDMKFDRCYTCMKNNKCNINPKHIKRSSPQKKTREY